MTKPKGAYHFGNPFQHNHDTARNKTIAHGDHDKVPVTSRRLIFRARMRSVLREVITVSPTSAWREAGFGALCAVCAIVVRAPLELHLLKGSLPYVFFFPAVIIAVLHRGALAAAVTVGVSALYIGLATASLSQFPLYISFALFLASSFLIICVGVELRLTMRELRQAANELNISKQRLRILVRESEHRYKNSLTIAAAISRLTASNVLDLEEFKRVFPDRLLAMSGAQSLLALDDANVLDLCAIVDNAVGRLIDTTSGRIIIIPGRNIKIPYPHVISLSLLLHELATNSIKYGALSYADGEVVISWASGSSHNLCSIKWLERNGPPVAEPVRKGFGSELFRALSVDGFEIDRDFVATGLRCTVSVHMPVG